MGAEKSTLSRDKQKGSKPTSEPTDEYRPCYDKWKTNKAFVVDLLNQNKKFSQNLLKLFPNARDSYPNFLQMIFYLRKYDPHIQHHQQAKRNAKNTNILDRFFMVCLGLPSFQLLESTQLNSEERQKLFLSYMELFIVNPEKGFSKKLSDYTSIEENTSISVKKFSETLREYFPHVQRYLKDYYLQKFRDLVKNGLLLRNFDSNIMKEDAVFMSLKLERLCQKEIKMLYSSQTFGLSFHSIQKQIVGYTGPWMLIAEHHEKDNNGEKCVYRFGAYQSGPIVDTNKFQGNLQGFLFSIEPKIKYLTTDRGDNGQNYFYLNTIDEKLSKLRKGIGFGGSKHKQNFKLWIDEDLDKSKIYNGDDVTYGFGTLVNLSTTNLSIRKLEIWGLGSFHDLENQQEYWKQRNEEIMKRRKVNKKQLIDGNAGLIFQKTFAHRDQVYGQIERNEKEEEN